MVTVLRQMMVLFVLQVQQGHTLKRTLCVLRKQIQQLLQVLTPRTLLIQSKMTDLSKIMLPVLQNTVQKNDLLQVQLYRAARVVRENLYGMVLPGYIVVMRVLTQKKFSVLVAQLFL